MITAEQLEEYGLRPENARSWLICKTLMDQRGWLTDPDGEIVLHLDTCIVSTRMVVEVCRYFGIKAKPVPTSAAVFNRKGFEEYEAWHKLPDEVKATTPMKFKDDDAWCVAVEGDNSRSAPELGRRSPRWGGHLIAAVDDALLVDFSLDQFSRPERDMEVEPEVFPIQDIWRDYGIAFYRREDGVTVHYKHEPAATDYRTAPDWLRRQWRPVIGRLITRVKKELDE